MDRKTKPTPQPRNTNSALGRAYWEHHASVMRQTQPKIMGHVAIDVLERIERFACDNPDSPVAQMHQEMLAAIGPDATAGDPQTVSRFSDLYRDASGIVFPASGAFLAASHAVGELTRSHSLAAIDLATLRAIDLEAHRNPVLDTFRNDLKSRLDKGSDIDDVTAYSQSFEIYGEAVAYLHLRERVQTARLAEQEGTPIPDFQCTLADGKVFYVEVKSFDVVEGRRKNLDMLNDGLDASAELENQVHAGKRIAFATTEIAPFRKVGETKTYDPWSLMRVTDTLRAKCDGAFKGKQFALGPTFGLAIIDRLALVDGRYDLAPYYHVGFNDGGIASGVLWHMAYGRPGTPIFRLPEFAGAQSLEGHLEKLGLFVDEKVPFPGPGLIVLNREGGSHQALGLVNEAYAEDAGWSVDDTHHALESICERWNDLEASRSYDISAHVGEGSPE